MTTETGDGGGAGAVPAVTPENTALSADGGVNPTGPSGVPEGGTDPATTEPGDEAGKQGAPEQYEAFKLPEGMDVDSAMLEQFTPVAKELGLDQTQAQKLVDFYAKAVTDADQSLVDGWVERQQQWLAEAKADREIGGVKFDQTVAHAKSFIKEFGDETVQQALIDTGAGNHPAFIRMLAKAGKAMGEGEIHTGSPPGQDKRPLEQRMYPSHNQ